MKQSLALAPSIFLLLIALPAFAPSKSFAQDAASFNPNGTWSIALDDRCSGVTSYTTSDLSINGGDFQCSTYLEKKSQVAYDTLQIQYDPKTRTVRLTGGPSTLPRKIKLDQDRIGVSEVKLFPRITPQSPECDLQTYFLETLRFDNSKTMKYGYITVNEFIPHKDSPQGCEKYLSELKQAVRLRTATGFLLAMRDINALNVDKMEDLSNILMTSDYNGVKREQG